MTGGKAGETLTLGVTLDAQSDSLKNNAFDMKTGFGGALWADYSETGAAGTGWQVSGALGYSHATGTVTRGRLLTDVVTATGDTSLTTRAVEAQIGYGFTAAPGLTLTSVTVATIGRCWPAAIRSTNSPGRRGRIGGQVGRTIGNQSARCGSIPNDPTLGAEAMGPSTRSPIKLAAAAQWPGPQIAQPENE